MRLEGPARLKSLKLLDCAAIHTADLARVFVPALTEVHLGNAHLDMAMPIEILVSRLGCTMVDLECPA